jgi:hypothetical protein
MPKKSAGGKAGTIRQAKIERMLHERPPPNLSEKLIAQLQGAVEAAQRRRRAQAAPTGVRRTPRAPADADPDGSAN